MPGDEDTTVVVEKPKRAPRKRTPKPEAEGDGSPAPVSRAPRRQAVRKTVRKKVDAPETPAAQPAPTRTTARKAPTRVATTDQSRKSARRQWIVVLLLLVVGIGSSAAVGFTDDGSVDINAIITARNERIQSGQEQGTIIPVQNTSREPDGGLIPLGDSAVSGGVLGTPPPVSESAASTTASSTEPVGNVPLSNEEAAAVAAAESETAPAEPAP